MTRTRRIASLVAIAFAVAGMSIAPVGAAAPRPSLSRQEDARTFKSWAEGRMATSQQRMLGAVGGARMSAEKRQQITNDVYYSVGLLRTRIDEAARDNVLTQAERDQIFGLNGALRNELAKHGNFDTWQIL
jgi:hypothetical protein